MGIAGIQTTVSLLLLPRRFLPTKSLENLENRLPRLRLRGAAPLRPWRSWGENRQRSGSGHFLGKVSWPHFTNAPIAGDARQPRTG